MIDTQPSYTVLTHNTFSGIIIVKSIGSSEITPPKALEMYLDILPATKLVLDKAVYPAAILDLSAIVSETICL